MPTKFNTCVNVTRAKNITALENFVFCRLLQYPQKDFLKSVEDICWNILSCRHVDPESIEWLYWNDVQNQRAIKYKLTLLGSIHQHHVPKINWKKMWAPPERKHHVILSVSPFLSFIESTLPS